MEGKKAHGGNIRKLNIAYDLPADDKVPDQGENLTKQCNFPRFQNTSSLSSDVGSGDGAGGSEVC